MISEKEKSTLRRVLESLAERIKTFADTLTGAESRILVENSDNLLALARETNKTLKEAGKNENSKSVQKYMKYSIQHDAKGRTLVVLDRGVFSGITDMYKRADLVEKFIIDNFGGKSYDTADYHFVGVDEKTAWKTKYWNYNMNEAEFSLKLSASPNLYNIGFIKRVGSYKKEIVPILSPAHRKNRSPSALTRHRIGTILQIYHQKAIMSTKNLSPMTITYLQSKTEI